MVVSGTTGTATGNNLTAKLLPQNGDRVRIDGLKAKEHNGKFGTVKKFLSEKQRYMVSVIDSDNDCHEVGGSSNSSGERGQQQQVLGIRLSNLTVVETSGKISSSSSSSLHILIPCHIDHDRRMMTFQRCADSLLNQIYPSYSIFVGLSGPVLFREKATTFLALLASGMNSSSTRRRIYLQDEDVERRPQMEHLRSLLYGGSMIVNSSALLTFVDNDDMCNPYRFHMLMDAYNAIPVDNGRPYTLSLPCKLLLDSSLSAEDGRLENFVDKRNPNDFYFWRKKFGGERATFGPPKVQLARSDQKDDLDCAEYFDYVVPTSVLDKFMMLTPETVSSHRFCDLRLYQVFSYLEPFEMDDPHPGMWLLAHYKVSMDDKWTTFDNHGRRDQRRLGHSVDQISFQEEVSTSADAALSERYPKLSPGQVAMCRGHLESIILSYIGWNEKDLDVAKRDKTFELNKKHGMGFGNELWDECEASMIALFDEKILSASKGAWQKPIDDDDGYGQSLFY